jgi:hypothetical protein
MSFLESEMLRSRTNCRPQQNPLLQKPSEKRVERREIVQEIPGSSSQTLNNKSTIMWQIRADRYRTVLKLDNRKWKFCCQKQAWLRQKWNKTQSKPAERYPKSLFYAPNSPICARTRYYTDQTRQVRMYFAWWIERLTSDWIARWIFFDGF